MWTNYGVPKTKAVRIRFSKKAITNWLAHNTAKEIAIYGVPKEGESHGDAVELIDTPVSFVGFVDVAYFGRNQISDTNSDGIHYHGKSFRLKEGKWRKKVEGYEGRYGAMFKKRGWAYEHEVRLLIELAKPLPERFDKLAIDFTGPIDEVTHCLEKNMTVGPWYKEGDDSFAWLGCDMTLIPQSVFLGELHMRSICDRCKKKGKNACVCDFADWRSGN